jgi:hypothetical protein
MPEIDAAPGSAHSLQSAFLQTGNLYAKTNFDAFILTNALVQSASKRSDSKSRYFKKLNYFIHIT